MSIPTSRSTPATPPTLSKSIGSGERSELVPILTHAHADFDALASLLAAALLYPEATPVLPHQLGRSVGDFLTLYRNLFPFSTADEWASRLGRDKVARAIVVDTQSFDYVKGMTDDTPRYIIDHHQLGEKLREPPDGWTVWHEPLGANVTLLIEQLMAQGLMLSSAQATLMALGIHADTGSLTYSNATARDAAALAWLMQPEHEINLDVLGRFLHYPLGDEENALLQTLVDQMTWASIGEAAGNTARRATLLFARATVATFDGSLAAIATRLREMFDPDALFVLVQIDDLIQIVARSRLDGINVGQVAEALGGGGHPRAAAAAIDAEDRKEPLGEVLAALPDKILALLNEGYQPSLTVADIMTHGRPQTLPPDLPIGEAIERMTHYGYEGFPVVEPLTDDQAEGEPKGEATEKATEKTKSGRSRLVGVFTRRQADRAMRHGLHKEPVRRFMRAGHVFVHPGDSIQVLHHAMIESGWGQIPVLAEPGDEAQHDDLIGIVTRTDLIKTWGQDESLGPGSVSAQREAGSLGNPSRYAALLQEALPTAQHALLQRIGREAAAAGLSTYVVGGFVRDLLLHAAKEHDANERDANERDANEHDEEGDAPGKVNQKGGDPDSSSVEVDSVEVDSVEVDSTEIDSIDNVDIDIVFEGDALAFAQQMQQRFGGRLVTHARFGTAKWILRGDAQPVDWTALLGNEANPVDLPPHLDLISARMEFYAEPSALPTVERSSIKLDLHRRDFTINTLALSLHPARWARLYDFYGGLADLRRGVLSVLHSLSFVDDPTRILRGVRYEQRFGFHLAPRTLDLLHDALDLIDRVTPARLNHELDRILQEAQPERSLARLEELGVLAALHPALQLDERVPQWFRDLRFAIYDLREDSINEPSLVNHKSKIADWPPIERLYYALLVWPLDPPVDAALAERLGLRQETQRLVADVRRVRAARPTLTRDAAPSAIVQRLSGVEEAALGLARVVWASEHGPDDKADNEAVDVLGRYLETWRHVRPALDGNDLQTLGIPRGPRYGDILRALHHARLDGKISSREEEVALARKMGGV